MLPRTPGALLMEMHLEPSAGHTDEMLTYDYVVSLDRTCITR